MNKFISFQSLNKLQIITCPYFIIKMVIISAGVCDKIGKMVLSRQFKQFQKRALDQLYYSFPKLIKLHQQHTFVQTDKYRFLYIPIENIYLVLITTKASNIIEDQQTIKMLYKVILSVCVEGINEENIDSNCIDILLGFDDVISLGYRESVTLQEIEQQLKMESAQEKSFLAIKKQQQEDAKQAVKKQLEKNVKGSK